MGTPVEGVSNHGVADVGRPPVKIGGVATVNALPTAEQLGDLLQLCLSPNGAIVISGGVPQVGFDGTTPTPICDVGGSNNNRPLLGGYLFNGASWDRPRVPVVFKSFASTAITAGTGATVWTPAAGKKFRLMGWLISTSAAGQLIFGDNLVATVIARSEAVIAAGVSKITDADMGNGILSAAANNVLKLDGPTGNVAGMVWGTEE